MTDEDVKKLGEEFERVLNPVYEQLDRIEETLEGHSKVLAGDTRILNEHTDKIDALTAEMHDFHQEFGVNKDKTHSEIDKIKVHVGLSTPPTT